MNNDLTIDTLAFKLAYSDKSGSKRQEVSRGPTLPTTMSIASQIVKDPKSGLPAKRTVLRFDRTQVVNTAGDTNALSDISAYVVVQVPQGSEVESADILAVVQHLVSTLQEDDSGLDLMDEIFVNGEQ